MRAFIPMEVIRFVAMSCRVPVGKVLSDSRAMPYLRARAVSARIMRERGMSYPHIGRILRRDQSSIQNLVKTFDDKWQFDPELHATLDAARDEFLA